MSNSGKKKICVFTSGGDCAGLNAAIRGVVHRAILGYGWDVIGSFDGTEGLLNRPMRYRTLTLDDVNPNVLRQGSTILGAYNKGNVPPTGEMLNAAIRELGIDAVIAIGGDGSFSIVSKLLDPSIQFVGIPKTMDNDVSGTEMSIGFHSAVGVATEALDRLHPTAAGHQRVMVLEVMGRDAGHGALETGIAGGADVILLPEIPWNPESVVKKLKAIRESGRNYATIVVSEAAKLKDGAIVQKEFAGGQKRYGGIGEHIVHIVSSQAEMEARAMMVGHTQRGCAPTFTDRLIGQVFGAKAVDLIAEGKTHRVTAWRGRQVIDIPMEEAIGAYHAVDPCGTLVNAARALGISFGDE